MTVAFKDHFSGHAAGYAQARPGYPDELYAWLAGQSPGTDLAWDVATGNGQAASGLAAHFTRVFASDASAQQISNASGPDNVQFAVEPAEQCSLQDHAADLVCVAQALHWFEQDSFHREVRRVLRPGGLFAAWTYQLNSVSEAVDAVVRDFYDGPIGPHWPPERRHVECGYRSLPFPYREVPDPGISMETRSSLQQLLAYLRTWSAVQRYQAELGVDPVNAIEEPLAAAWGEPGTMRVVRWPLVLRCGYVNGRDSR
jgi:SAM-dependent methyltransferase